VFSVEELMGVLPEDKGMCSENVSRFIVQETSKLPLSGANE